MKRILAAAAAVILTLALGTTALAAGGRHAPKCAAKTGSGVCAFVDENGDGVCDNCRFTDENGDGICDNCRFTDEDGDGVCDNYGDRHPQDGTGHSGRHSSGRHGGCGR